MEAWKKKEFETMRAALEDRMKFAGLIDMFDTRTRFSNQSAACRR